ncbi:MAG TPA: hypothetical protein VHV51_11810 [Polyangiaceae bacterium]|jgi:hypothetical protein|nr:hypothetical protein [Polyangiaceae bacterium]
MSQQRNSPHAKVAFACLLGALALASSACSVGVDAGYPAGDYDDYPSDAYIATTEPVYFNGRATYWYNNHWYYRDGNRWSHYDQEPPALASRRAASPPARRTYERPAASHVAARPAARTSGAARGRR